MSDSVSLDKKIWCVLFSVFTSVEIETFETLCFCEIFRLLGHYFFY